LKQNQINLENPQDENKTDKNNLIRSITNKVTCPITISKDLDDSKDILNSSQNKSFSDTKEKLKHYNMLSKTPLSSLLKNNNY